MKNEIIRLMTILEWIRLRIRLLVAGFVVLSIAFLSPWNIKRMRNDILQQIEEHMIEERNR